MTFTKQSNCLAYFNKPYNKNASISFKNKWETPDLDPMASLSDNLKKYNVEIEHFKKVAREYVKYLTFLTNMSKEKDK